MCPTKGGVERRVSHAVVPFHSANVPRGPLENLIQIRRLPMRIMLLRNGCAALIATTLLLGPSTAQATVLVPGGTVVPEVLTGAAGTLLAAATGLPFDTGDVMGT